MATEKNAIYKVHNGTDFDTINFKTKASQVIANDGSNLETHLAENTMYQANFTRDLSLVGEQIINLLPGRTTKKITVFSAINNRSFASWGMATQDSQFAIGQIESGNMTNFVNSTIVIRTSNGNFTTATATISEGQVIFNWSKTGSPVGTLNVGLVAEYHD